MYLNEIGCMIKDVWLNIAKMNPGVELDEFVIMPNHLHGIIYLDLDVSTSIPKIISKFKSYTAYLYREGAKNQKWPYIKQGIWQRNYYEHVIRNEGSLTSIREYIVDNPMKWELDRENPNNIV